jgi:glycosyltransferase involved in cell wall biosynthesis
MSNPSPAAARRIDVVIAAHDDVGDVVACVERVLRASSKTRFELFVAVAAQSASRFDEALSPGDARVKRIVAQGNPFDALDAALSSRTDRDLVVLSPDARVADDWLDRLVAHVGDATGIVGTFTNANGTATYPQGISPGAFDASSILDAQFASANRGRSVDVDAVRGPCRYVTRAFLRALGTGPGVAANELSAIDLSHHARRLGYRTSIAADVFVARGSTSAAAHALAAAPSAGEADALLACASRVGLARLAASPLPAIVFVSHGWGGGVRRHMRDLDALAAGRADVLHLEPAGDARVRLSWPRENETFSAHFRLPEDLATLASTLRAIGVARIHFHHVHGLPREVLDLPGAAGVPYDCTLHDYYAICPQYHLADARGRYCGEPDAAGCAACLAERPSQWNIDIATWRALFAPFLARAERVIAPSEDVATRMRRYFPSLSIGVWPHPEHVAAQPATIARVVTLGNLSPEKGLHVVGACALDARARGLPLAFRVLGATATRLPQWPQAPLSVHGSYDDDRLVELLAAERADVLFFPAQVPETYSYTLSVALASGMPIVASAIGAFPERLAGRANARLLPFDASARDWNEALIEMAAAPTLPVDVSALARPPLRAAS